MPVDCSAITVHRSLWPQWGTRSRQDGNDARSARQRRLSLFQPVGRRHHDDEIASRLALRRRRRRRWRRKMASNSAHVRPQQLPVSPADDLRHRRSQLPRLGRRFQRRRRRAAERQRSFAAPARLPRVPHHGRPVRLSDGRSGGQARRLRPVSNFPLQLRVDAGDGLRRPASSWRPSSTPSRPAGVRVRSTACRRTRPVSGDRGGRHWRRAAHLRNCDVVLGKLHTNWVWKSFPVSPSLALSNTVSSNSC